MFVSRPYFLKSAKIYKKYVIFSKNVTDELTIRVKKVAER